jgi:ABC-type uncharacterized transport system YnjBCD substrate-binding protein
MDLPKPQNTRDVKAILEWNQRLWQWLLRLHMNVSYTGSTTWDPASIADGGMEAKEVTVTGAVLGDFAIASFSLDVSDLALSASVTAANTVTCTLSNNTGGAVDLGSGTVSVLVIQKQF